MTLWENREFFYFANVYMIKTAVLFDLEGVVYDPINQCLCAWFPAIYESALQNSMVIWLATGATQNELDIIDQNIGLKKLFWENIFCTSSLWFTSKKDPWFFSEILNRLWVRAWATRMVDDGENGIQWAKLAWLATYYTGNNKIKYCDDYGNLENFLFVLQTTNDNQDKRLCIWI